MQCDENQALSANQTMMYKICPLLMLQILTNGLLVTAWSPSLPSSSLSVGQQTPTRLLATLDSIDASRAASSTPIATADAVVCGGGPAGLLSAIMLADKYPTRTIQVFDRLAAPPPADDPIWDDVAKFYLIGLGGRGQKALKAFGVWDAVEERAVGVIGRKDWPPDSKEGVERIFTAKDKHVTTMVLPRDKLVGVLHQHIVDNYAGRIELNYGYEVLPVDFEYKDGTAVLVEVAKCTEEVARLNPSSVKTATEEPVQILCDTDSATLLAADFLIAADGTVRTFANAMEAADRKRIAALPLLRRLGAKPFHVKRYVDDNQRIYKTIPMKVPADWRPDLNYSARTKEGRINFDALPANNRGDYCGVLLLKKGDPLAAEDTNPQDLRQLLDEALPQFSALLDDETVATVAKKPVSYLPGFRYAGPRLHQGNRCVILGDCAHTVKPYFGLGANSALEDVVVLSRILDDKPDYATAVKEFSKQRAADSKMLVRISRELDRPGKIGFVTFILPLILDSIFYGMFPKLFRPNIIAMLQREQYTFRQVGRRKRLDRLVQVTMIFGGLYGIVATARWAIRCLAKAVGKSSTTVTASLAGTLAAVALLKKAARFLVPGLAPADVLTRITDKVTNSRTHLTPLRKLKRDKDTTNGETFLTALGNENK